MEVVPLWSEAQQVVMGEVVLVVRAEGVAQLPLS